ncbi:MAG: hypothetical protein V3S69_05285 [Dehalococcoidales bacterium]
MARQRGTAQQFTPSKGFATEFTKTRFPTDAAVDLSNVIIDVDGSTRRRPGANFEVGYALNQVNGGIITPTEKLERGFSVDLWKAVSNSGTLNIVVVQYGSILQFYAQVGNISGNLLGELDLTPFATDIGSLLRERVASTSGLGNLYVVGEFLEPIRISYDGTSFSAEVIDFRERDLEGLDDGLETEERPEHLTLNHYYNLLNQGWLDENIAIVGGYATDTDLCAGAASGVGLVILHGEGWPSNSEIMTTGLTVSNDGDPVFADGFMRDSNFAGNTPAPKGHFILNPFFKDYDAVSECAGIGSVELSTRPITVAFHNGKVFYASPATQGQPSGIFYSQTLTEEDKAGEMLQEADPTSDSINDLVATDGGFIPTPAVGQVYRLEEFGNGVVVGASNGIWFLSGADTDSGFTATSNRLTKISDDGMLSASSYIEADATAFYFSTSGIIAVTQGQGGVPVTTNISDASIQTFYISIAADARRSAQGTYLKEQRKVYWAYSDAPPVADTSITTPIDSLLIFDLNIKGFYKHTIGVDTDNDYPEVIGLTDVPSIADTVQEEEVTTTTGEVIYLADGVTPVTTVISSKASQVTQLKLLTMVKSTSLSGWTLTFSELNDRTFHDWREFSSDGVGINYLSFIEFGYNTYAAPVAGGGSIGGNHTKGTPTYVHSFFSKDSKNLTPGGYYELPPIFTATEGLTNSQCVLEVLHTANPDLAVSQSVVEVLLTANPALLTSQTVLEVLSEV